MNLGPIFEWILPIILGGLALASVLLGLRYVRKKERLLDVEQMKKDGQNDRQVGDDQTHRVRIKGLGDNQPNATKEVKVTYRRMKRGKKSAIFFCSGLGLDHSDFSHFEGLFQEHDLVFVTLPGFEVEPPNDQKQYTLLEAAELYHAFVDTFCSRRRYNEALLVGFSVGADILALCAKSDKLAGPVRGLVMLDPNIGPSTLFISTFISGFKRESLDLEDMINLTANIEFKSLRSWANSHEYFVKIARKFQGKRIQNLAVFAASVCKEYQEVVPRQYSEKLQKGVGRHIKVALLFSNDTPALQVNDVFRELSDVNFVKRHHLSLDHFDLVRNTDVVREAVREIC